MVTWIAMLGADSRARVWRRLDNFMHNPPFKTLIGADVFGIRLTFTGPNIPKIGKRGFRSQKL